MCLASAYRLRFRLLPHARRLSVLTTTLRSPLPVGSFHDAFALRFYSHETWPHPPYLWTNVRTNRHCISTEIARMQLAQVTNKTEIVQCVSWFNPTCLILLFYPIQYADVGVAL